MSIQIGPIKTRNRVFLAPLSGVTDEPFRAAAHEFGAGLVVSEMVASEELARARPDMVRRAMGAGKLSANLGGHRIGLGGIDMDPVTQLRRRLGQHPA